MIYEFLDVSLFQSNLIHVFRIFFQNVQKLFTTFRLDLYLLQPLNVKCHSLRMSS